MNRQEKKLKTICKGCGGYGQTSFFKGVSRFLISCEEWQECFGLGYVGTALGNALLQQGWHVSGTVRKEQNRARLATKGFEVYCDDDSSQDNILTALKAASHIVVTIPPNTDGDPVLAKYQTISQPRAYTGTAKERGSAKNHLRTPTTHAARDGLKQNVAGWTVALLVISSVYRAFTASAAMR